MKQWQEPLISKYCDHISFRSLQKFWKSLSVLNTSWTDFRWKWTCWSDNKIENLWKKNQPNPPYSQKLYLPFQLTCIKCKQRENPVIPILLPCGFLLALKLWNINRRRFQTKTISYRSWVEVLQVLPAKFLLLSSKNQI